MTETVDLYPVEAAEYRKGEKWLKQQKKSTASKAIWAVLTTFLFWFLFVLVFRFVWGAAVPGSEHFLLGLCEQLSVTGGPCAFEAEPSSSGPVGAAVGLAERESSGRFGPALVPSLVSLFVLLPLSVWISIRWRWPTRPPHHVEALLNRHSGKKVREIHHTGETRTSDRAIPGEPGPTPGRS